MVQHSGLTVIIPTINEYDNLSRLLPFLRDNTPIESLEIIVSDASEATSEILNLCQQYKAKYLKHTICRRSIQLDSGANCASNDNLLFLHADVTPPINFFSLVTELLNKPKTCGCFSYQFDSTCRLLRINASTTKKVGLFTGGGDQGLAITKQDYIRLGGYNTSVTFMEDFEFYDRIKASNLTFCIIPGECTVSARKYEKNSYWRVNLVHFVVFFGYKLGLDQNRLASWYSALIKK